MVLTSDIDPSALQSWLLVSDIDDTFLGLDAATEHLIDLAADMPHLRIALNSSRPLASVELTLRELPRVWRPIATITALGTEIAIDGRFDSDWQNRFAGWDRKPIDELAAKHHWTPHRPIFQTSLKASFSLPSGFDWNRTHDAVMSLKCRCKVIVSGGGDLDVIPESAGKGAATLFLAELLGIKLPQLIVAGDSANDIDLFRVARHGIVVGNARDELKAHIIGEGVFFATAPCAAGIIQGLEHFGVMPSPHRTGNEEQHTER
jgi:sucrose-6F-phosphate phosphohydrolase